MAGFNNEVMYATNMDFTGGTPPTGQIVADGQLFIGSSVAPFLRAATLTAGSNMTITNGHGTITLASSGGGSLPDPVTVPHGGTGLTTLTAHSLYVGNGASSPTALGAATNGQIPIGSTGNDPVLATITAGANISVTNAAGSITIAASGGGGGITWSVITANQTASVNNGYICNKASTLALLLPAASAVGDLLEVTGINTALGWQITQAAGQQIFFGTSSTTAGAGGSLTSSATRDSIRLVCVVANLTWNVLSVQGNITVV